MAANMPARAGSGKPRVMFRFAAHDSGFACPLLVGLDSSNSACSGGKNRRQNSQSPCSGFVPAAFSANRQDDFTTGKCYGFVPVVLRESACGCQFRGYRSANSRAARRAMVGFMLFIISPASRDRNPTFPCRRSGADRILW